MSPLGKAAPSAVVGLDIGSDSIKVAEARAAKDGITITGLGIARTPEGTVQDEVIIDPKGLANAIKALMTESGIKARKCVSSVSGQSQVVVRVIEVPKMQPDELAETMKWEIERHVPFAPTEVEYDFHPLDRPGADPDAQEMEVLLAVAQQEVISSHVETLLAAGLKPMAIDIEPLAASRALIELSGNGALDETVAVVNIGANSTDVGIFENGILTFPSPPIAIAGVNFTREIAEALGQTLDQAEVTKKEYAAVDLSAMATVAPPADTGVVEPDEPEEAAEPTQYDTAFGPQAPEAAREDEEAPQRDRIDLGASPSSAFTETVDGPVFDVPGEPSGPVFDLGDSEPGAAEEPTTEVQQVQPDEEGHEVAAGPAFDLGAQSAAADSATSFDVGGDQAPAGDSETPLDLGGDESPQEQQGMPDFDLEDDEPSAQVSQEPQGPAFDLSDADEHAVAPPPEEPTSQQLFPVVASGQGSTTQQVFAAISSVLLEMADDLRRSLEYYSTKYSKTPSRVFLCGGTAKMPKLDEFLSRELGVPVQVADPLNNVRVDVTGASQQYLREISPLFSVSIGLAIRDMIG